MKNNGGTAFPSHGTMGEVNYEGMSLRDWFAGQAMLGMCANPDLSKDAFNKKIPPVIVRFSFAVSAYRMADAMLEEREKKAKNAQ